jgi:hypothetical protein
MIKDAPDGQKHYILLKSSMLIGGHIAGGSIIEEDGIRHLETEVKKRDIDSLESAQKTILDGIKYGKMSPLKIDLKQDAILDHGDTNTNIPFPIAVFPKKVIDFINSSSLTLNYPPDFTASAFLFLASLLNGNNYKLEVKPGYIANSIIWIAIVGEPGTVKSHPINTVLDPIRSIDSDNYIKYAKERADYERAMMEQKDKKSGRPPDLVKPRLNQYLLDDVTMEGVTTAHQHNSNGMGVHKDELVGWLGDMNKYRKGSDLQFWLTSFNNQAYSYNRKTQDPIRIENPHISIIGSIQPSELRQLHHNYKGNGLFDRFLYAYPDIEPVGLNGEKMPHTLLEEHTEMIESIIEGLNKVISSDFREKRCHKLLKMTVDAQDLFYQIDNELAVNMCNENTSEFMKSYLSKIRTYVPRFSLIMELITSWYINKQVDQVHLPSVQKAKKLIDYFIATARKFYQQQSEKTDVENIINKKMTMGEQIQALLGKGVKPPIIERELGVSRQYVHKIKKTLSTKVN